MPLRKNNAPNPAAIPISSAMNQNCTFEGPWRSITRQPSSSAATRRPHCSLRNCCTRLFPLLRPWHTLHHAPGPTGKRIYQMTVQAALDELHLLLGDRLSRSKSELDQHATSETYFPPAPPDAVAFPQTTEEVSALMKICARAQCPVVGWGAGTSLEGQAQAFSGGVVV